MWFKRNLKACYVWVANEIGFYLWSLKIIKKAQKQIENDQFGPQSRQFVLNWSFFKESCRNVGLIDTVPETLSKNVFEWITNIHKLKQKYPQQRSMFAVKNVLNQRRLILI